MRLISPAQTFGLVTSGTSTTHVDVVYEATRGIETKNASWQTVISAATTTEIVKAPQSPFTHIVLTLSIRNAGGSAQTVTFQKTESAVSYTIIRAQLATGESLHYENDRGWYTMDANGAEKLTGIGGGGGGGVGISAGTESVSTGTVEFLNSNGITFGMSNSSQITASHNGLTTAALSNHSHGNPQLNLTNLSGTTASNSAGFTLSLAAGNYLTTARASNDAIGLNTAITQNGVSMTANSSGLSLNFPAFLTTAMQSNAATLSNIRLSAGTTSNLASAFTFSNSNGISFGLDAGTFTASHNGLTTAALSNHSHGNPQLNLTNLSGTTASNSAGFTLSLSAAAPGGGGAVNFSAGTTSNNLQSVTFADGNGISFGLDGSTITATVKTDYLTTAMQSNAVTISNIRLSAGTTSNLASAFTFGNANNFSFGLDNGTITGSYTVPTVTNSSMTVSDAATSGTLGRLAFTNLNGVTLSLSTGAGGSHTIVGSHNALTSQSNQNVTAQNGGFAFQTLSFSNLNGISFGTSAGSAITASHNALTTAMASNRGTDFVQATAAFAGTNASGTIASNGISVSVGNYITTARASTDAIGLNTAQSNVTWTVNSAGLSLDARGYAGTGTTFNGANVSGSMTLNSNGLNLSLSAPTPGGGGAINVTAGTTSGNLQTLQFNNGNGVTFGLDGSTVTASVNAGGGGATNSGFMPFQNPVYVTAGMSNASLIIRPIDVQAAFQYDRMVMPLHYSQATNSTLTVTNSVWWGFFTKNASSLSLLYSGSGTFSINGSGTASSSANSGIRLVSLGHTTTITQGNYFLGYVWRSTTAGANASQSNLVVSNINSSISGYLGVGSATNIGYPMGNGVWTSTTAGMPNSLAFSDIRANSSAYLRYPIFNFTSGSF